MTTDKTLADAKPGGCVQLPTSERERFEAWAESSGEGLSRWPDGLYVRQATQVAWDAWQAALSAQPSPGSQGDALAMIGANLRSIVRLCRPGDYSISRADAGDIHMEADHALQLLESALAARQPVGQEPVAWRYRAQGDKTKWYYSDTASLLGLYQPLYAAPAQAVDLGEVIEQIAEQWDGCSYDAVGETIDVGQAIRAAGERLIDSQAVGNG